QTARKTGVVVGLLQGFLRVDRRGETQHESGETHGDNQHDRHPQLSTRAFRVETARESWLHLIFELVRERHNYPLAIHSSRPPPSRLPRFSSRAESRCQRRLLTSINTRAQGKLHKS